MCNKKLTFAKLSPAIQPASLVLPGGIVGYGHVTMTGAKVTVDLVSVEGWSIVCNSCAYKAVTD